MWNSFQEFKSELDRCLLIEKKTWKSFYYILNNLLNWTCLWIMDIIWWWWVCIRIKNWQLERNGEKICDISWPEIFKDKKTFIEFININTWYKISDIN